MRDLISREAALQEVLFRCNQEIAKYRTMHRALGNVGRAAYDGVKAVPAVDAAPVVHGRWELHGNDDDCELSYFCSNCHSSYDEDCFYDHNRYAPYRYCPNCDAKMDREEV